MSFTLLAATLAAVGIVALSVVTARRKQQPD
jgi:hypothetical protein